MGGSHPDLKLARLKEPRGRRRVQPHTRPELELPLLGSGCPIVTRLAKITIGRAPGAGSDPPITTSALRAHTDSALLDAAADRLLPQPKL